MKNNSKPGIALAILGILVGLLLAYQIASIYQSTIDGKITGGRPDEAITVQVVFAILGWLTLAAASLMGVSLYGFANKLEWGWFWGTVAATIYMLTAFFPIIPPASVGLPSPTAPTFGLAAVIWFGMLLLGGVDKKIIALAFVAGLAYVLTYMDGVADISRYQTVPDPLSHGIYAVTQMVNWWGAAAWAVFIFSLLRRKTWVVPLGVFAAMMSMLGGFPLGITDVIRLGRFSMFLPAPLISTGLLVYLLLPSTRRMLEAWNARE
ncbi:MAG: hypothetical protein AB1564_11395 [Chloroflexota bacterium]